MKWAVAALAAVFLCSAGDVHAKKLKNMKPPATAAWFSLDQEHVYVERRGKNQTPFVTFLSAGIYQAVREDDEGVYFLGPIDCIQFTSRGVAEEYLAASPRQRPPKNTEFGEAWIIGGLWLPKPNVNATPKLFYDIRVAPKSREECQLDPLCSLGLGPLANLMFEGSLSIKEYPDAEFIASLKIQAGESPANSP